MAKIINFIFKSFITIIIGISIGWFMADTQLHLKLMKEVVEPFIKTIKVTTDQIK